MPDYNQNILDLLRQGPTVPSGITDQNQINSMTHQVEQPNTAQPYIDAVKQYMQGGVPAILQNKGIQVSQPVDWFGKVLNNPDNVAAIGMGAPVGNMNRTISSIWSDPKKVELLKQLHSQGATHAEKAKIIGTTRNSVAGKVDRLGLPDPRGWASLSRQTPSSPSISGAVGDLDYEKSLLAYLKSAGKI